MFDAMGLDVDTSSSKSIQEALLGMVDENGKPTNLNLVVSNMLLKSMVMAKYICAGDVEEPDYWHYGLSVPLYTHFTSPIRRYPDLIVHRQLQAILEGHSESPISGKKVARLAKASSEKKLASRKASEKSDGLFLWMFLKDQDVLYEKAVIIDIGHQWIEVLIERLSLNFRILKYNMDVDQFDATLYESVNIVWKADKKNGLKEGGQQLKMLDQVDLKLSVGKELFIMYAELVRRDLDAPVISKKKQIFKTFR